MHYSPNVEMAFNSVEHGFSLSLSDNLVRNFIILNKIVKNTDINSNKIELEIGNNKISDFDFYDWFRGFTDGEGSFTINIKSLNGNYSSIRFVFQIFLHKDDAPLLNIIQKKLNIGKVYIFEHFTSFTVTSQKEIPEIIKIFDNFPLNTSKHLNF